MTTVVIGGGLAAANAVDELRHQGYGGDIVLIGAEPHLPYERPPLSKGVLLGNEAPDSVFVHDRQWYDERQVDLRLGATATAKAKRSGRRRGSERSAMERMVGSSMALARRRGAAAMTATRSTAFVIGDYRRFAGILRKGSVSIDAWIPSPICSMAG